MHSHFRTILALGTFAAIGASLGVSPVYSDPVGQSKNPTSKLYVADMTGNAEINTGDKIQDLSKKSVHDAQGAIITTKKKSTNAMVYSNGTGIYFAPDTKVDVKKFVQEPFTPNRTDMSVEPSISNTYAVVDHGTVGLCTSKLVAGSSMTYATSVGSVSIRGGKVVIQATDQGTVVSLIQGDVTVRGGSLDMGGQNLKPGQQAILTPGGQGEPAKISIQPIPANEKSSLDNKVTMACMAKNTVYFDVIGRQEADSEAAKDQASADKIVAKPVTPDILPTDYTVSASRIGSP